MAKKTAKPITSKHLLGELTLIEASLAGVLLSANTIAEGGELFQKAMRTPLHAFRKQLKAIQTGLASSSQAAAKAKVELIEEFGGA